MMKIEKWINEIRERERERLNKYLQSLGLFNTLYSSRQVVGFGNVKQNIRKFRCRRCAERKR